MSMAIKYAMQKRHKKMAMGGPCDEHGTHMCEMCHGGEYAKGGYAEDREINLVERHDNEKGIHKSEYEPFPRPGYQEGKGGISSAGKKVRSGNYASAKNEHKQKLEELKSMKKPHLYSEGGAVEEDDRMLNQHGEHEVAAEGMMEDNEPEHERMVSHPVENQDDHEDMVGRIMKQRMMHYSKGGRVANDTPIVADFEPNQFDDLVKDDKLEEHYTGANSGDETGDAQEDEDRRDIVARIMRSRRLKDRMPRPA